jgi:hypothetical protein
MLAALPSIGIIVKAAKTFRSSGLTDTAGKCILPMLSYTGVFAIELG